MSNLARGTATLKRRSPRRQKPLSTDGTHSREKACASRSVVDAQPIRIRSTPPTTILRRTLPTPKTLRRERVRRKQPQTTLTPAGEDQRRFSREDWRGVRHSHRARAECSHRDCSRTRRQDPAASKWVRPERRGSSRPPIQRPMTDYDYDKDEMDKHFVFRRRGFSDSLMDLRIDQAVPGARSR